MEKRFVDFATKQGINKMEKEVKQDIEDLKHSYTLAETKEEKEEILEEIHNLKGY